MPKITDKIFLIAGHSQKFGVWYTDSDKFFIKDFDQNVAGQFTNKKFGKGCETQAELYEKAEKAIKAYEETIAESRKVILIKLNAAKHHISKYARGRDYEPSWLHHFYGDEMTTMGFEIEYSVKMFRKTGDRHEFFDLIGGNLCNKTTIVNLTMYQIIDWTQEKEDALNNLQSMFGNLLDKFVTAMKDPEKFIASINQQKLLS